MVNVLCCQFLKTLLSLTKWRSIFFTKQNCLLFAQLLETTVPDSLISESRITLKSCAICILKFWLDKDMKVKKITFIMVYDFIMLIDYGWITKESDSLMLCNKSHHNSKCSSITLMNTGIQSIKIDSDFALQSGRKLFIARGWLNGKWIQREIV